MVGIAMMFVLNLGVSFAIASFVALRAYDVGHKERASILRYVFRQMVSSPLQISLSRPAKQGPSTSEDATPSDLERPVSAGIRADA